MENRPGKLESDIEHIRSDISDLKVEGRRLSDKIDEVDKRLNVKIDELDKRLSGKIDALDQKLSAKIEASIAKTDEVDKRLTAEFRKMDRERLYDRVWFLLIAAALLGVMAHGFKWF